MISSAIQRIASTKTRFSFKIVSPSRLVSKTRDFSTEPSTPIQKNDSQNQYSKIAFIGCGKMAEALVAPLIGANIQTTDSISLNDVSRCTLNRVSEKYQIPHTSTCMTETVENADLIVFAVKPQNCDLVFDKLKNSLLEVGGCPTVLSVVAGKPINDFLVGCGGTITKVARSMPNTPAQIGKGVTVWTCTENVCGDERAKIKTVLCSFGKAMFVDDEDFIDMATSISGSGPAYIFMLMEAMIDAGVHMGFSREMATILVNHTLLGSTMYAMETGEHPAILRNSVTSPAGTTASAMYELENGRFRTVIKDAIWACYRRSLEMGGKSSNKGPGRHRIFSPSGEFSEEDGNGNGNGNGGTKK